MEQRQFFLRDILTVIFKHKFLITTLPIVVFAVVFVGNYLWPPTYESYAEVRIMRGREVSQTDPFVTPTASTLTTIQMTIEDINSEIQLLHSRDVLEATVMHESLRLDLDRNFPYSGSIIQTPINIVRDAIELALYAVRLKSRSGNAVHDAAAKLDELLVTEPVRDSHVLQVRLRLGDPVRAQKILGVLLEVYQKQHVHVFSNKESLPFFEEQKSRTENELNLAQSALQKFRADTNISLLDTEKELLLQQYTVAKKILSQLTETETALSQEGGVDSNIISTLSSQTESPVVRELQLRLLELILERNRIVQSLGPNHPSVLSAEKQVSISQENLIEAIANTKRITETNLKVIQARLDELNETKSRLEKMEQDVAIIAQNYEFYAQKLEESRVADQLAAQSISNVRISSSPSLPVEPIWPRKLLNLALALVGGIVGALAIAFFLDYLDHGLKTPEDVEHYTKLAPMASFFNAGGQPLDRREAERLAILLDTLTSSEQGLLLQVTSSIPNEGAGQVASALADAYSADPDSRTLLVDFTGKLGRATGKHGLTDVLLEQARFDDVFVTDASLAVVGRGTQGNYPSYLWGSDRMKSLVADLRRRYKYIIFCADPILVSHDAIKLAVHCDGVLISIKADATRREVVCRALDILKESKARVVGAVLTERTQTIPTAVYRRI